MLPLDAMKYIFNRSNEDEHFDPVRNWLMLLALVSVALVSILVWNIWTFNRVADGEMLGATVEMKAVQKEALSFEEIESIFASRAEESKKYRTGTYIFTDPSL